MAFGQQSGPPASAKQLAYLLSLLKAAGHESFRDARHPLGLTQRQAGGKFTTGEASALIDVLLNGERDESDEPVRAAPRAPSRPIGARPKPEKPDAREALVAGVPADVLADELRRRGWTVTEPPSAGH